MIHSEFVEFSWHVACDGYEVRESPARKFAPFLPGTEIIQAIGFLELYRPAHTDPVHRKFADLSDDAESLLAFIESYGFPIAPAGPESVDGIRDLRERMAAVIETIDKVNVARNKKERARAEIRARQVWVEKGPAQMTMELCRETTKSGGRAIVRKLRPATLFDYMLLLATSELEGGAAWRQCSQCGKHMPLGPGQGRQDRDTCSDACRQRKRYRNQKELGRAA